MSLNISVSGPVPIWKSPTQKKLFEISVKSKVDYRNDLFEKYIFKSKNPQQWSQYYLYKQAVEAKMRLSKTHQHYDEQY